MKSFFGCKFLDGRCELILNTANANRLANAYENRDFLKMIYDYINNTQKELKTSAQRIVSSNIGGQKKQTISLAHELVELFLKSSTKKSIEQKLLMTQVKTFCKNYLTNAMLEKNFDSLLNKLLIELQLLSKVPQDKQISLRNIAQEIAEGYRNPPPRLT